MESRQLRYFAAIYEHGSVSGAAQTERVAASAVSHHLANLEAELGKTLFERKPRGMRPTAAGERLYVHARSILDAMQSAVSDLGSDPEEIAGEVSVGMAHSAIRAIGVDMMRRVLTDHPKLRLSMSESLSGSTLQQLMASEVDLALVYNPPSDPTLKTVPVLEEKMVCLGLPEIVGDTAEPIRVEELFDLPLILLRQGLSARALMNDQALLKRLEVHARIQINSISAIAGCLVEGLGCVIGTKLFMEQHVTSGNLVARPIIEPELSRTLCVCELSSRPATFAIEAVRKLAVDLVVAQVRSGRWDASVRSCQTRASSY